jgi:hypothetical protein
MLYWHFRNLQCILIGLLGRRLSDPTQTLTKTFWANPFDSDWLSGVQAGRFFTYTDAFRWVLAIRSGFFWPAVKGRWVVVLGGQKIIHRRPVRIFRRFQLSIQFVGWDDRWIYAAHVFRQGGEVKCVSFSKIGLRQFGKLLNPQIAFNAMGHSAPKAPPEWIAQSFDQDLNNFSRADESLLDSANL